MPTRSTDADMVARLRVSAVTGQIAPEVVAWALRAIQRPRLVRLQRDLLLRDAAAWFQGDAWAQARHLLAMLERVRAGRVSDQPSQLEALLVAAHAIDPERPASVRQLQRIIEAA